MSSISDQFTILWLFKIAPHLLKNKLLQDKISAVVTEVGHASTVTQEAGIVGFQVPARAAINERVWLNYSIWSWGNNLTITIEFDWDTYRSK